MAERPKVDKIEAVVVQLEAAVYLILRNFRPEPVHTLLWASRTVLWDIHKVKPNPIFERFRDAVDRHVLPEFKKEWRKYQAKAANFLKHADRDPDDVLEGVDISRINEVEMLLCILAVRHYLPQLPMKLVLGLCLVGFSNNTFFDLRGLFIEMTGSAQEFDHYDGMDTNERHTLMLKAFDHLQDRDP